MQKVLDELSVDCESFCCMLDFWGKKYAKEYIEAEESFLYEFLLDNAVYDMNFVAVGGGDLFFLRMAMDHVSNYTIVEPFSNVYLNDSVRFLLESFPSIKIIEKPFEEVDKKDFSDLPNIYAFLFNVISYIEDPLEHINRIVKPGDVILISTWGDSEEARRVEEYYFSYVNNRRNEDFREKRKNNILLENFPYEQVRHFDHMSLNTMGIINVLAIHTK